MGGTQSVENKQKFQFIDRIDAQQFHFKPTNQTTSLQTRKQISSISHHGPVNGHVGQYTGLSDFIVPQKYTKFMQKSKQFHKQDPLICENPQIQSYSGYDPYMFKKSLNVYHGQWKNGKPHGQGKIFNPDRDYYYQGYFQQGLPSYYGVYIADKISYIGQINLGSAQGKGTYKDQNAIIEGEFKQNYPHKNCKQFGSNYEFQGEYHNGKWKKGKIIWDQGKSKYQGDFLEGIIHGNGLLKTQNYIYQGQFKNGKRHGLGKVHWNGGFSYKGSFIDDQINGNGQLFKDNKLIYRGEFYNGKAKGEGCIPQSQKMIHAIWNDGQSNEIS